MILILGSCKQVTNEIYVRSGSNPGNTGTKDSPLNSIEDALVLATELKQSNPKLPISIYLLEGVYRLDRPVRVTPELNGLKLVGEGSERVVIKGSKSWI